jgi:sugar/nucleoside kinase (ribokinase family)
MSRFAIVSAGFAYTDIVASVDQDFWNRHSIQPNVIIPMDANALRRMQRELPNPIITPGGASANTASVVAALGGKAGFFGKVGMDATGDLFLAAFRQAGVELCCPPQQRNTDLSATCMILLADNGQRSMVYNSGVAEQFQARDFRDFDFRSTGFFLVESQLLSSSRAAPVIIQAVEEAQGQTRIVINLQEIQNRKPFEALLPWIAAHADILIGNKAEHNAIRQFIQIPHSPSQLLVMTKGADGAEAWSNAVHCRVPACKPEIVVDTVGAGDAFSAGLLHGLWKGLDIERSLEHGARIASAMLGESGGRPTRSLRHLGMR